MNGVVWTIRLFGAFRRFGAAIEVTVPAETTACGIKEALAAKLLAEHGGNVAGQLVDLSVLATNREMLRNEETPPAGASLAILPPVSGG